MYIVASYTAAEADFGIIYVDLNSLSSPDKAFPGRQSWALGTKRIYLQLCV